MVYEANTSTILQFFRVLGLLPLQNKSTNKIYSYSVLLLVSILTAAKTYLDIINGEPLFIPNSASFQCLVVHFVFCNCKGYEKIPKYLQELLKGETGKNYLVFLTVYNIISLLFNIATVVRLMLDKYYWLDNFHWPLLTTYVLNAILLLHFCLRNVLNNLRTTNSKLEEIGKSTKAGLHLEKQIQAAINSHLRSTNMVSTFNSLFSPYLVILFIALVYNALQIVATTLSHEQFDLGLLFILHYFIYLLVPFAAVVWTGEEIKNEISRCGEQSKSLAVGLSKLGHLDSVLDRLVQQTNLGCPVLSAAGFFEIDNKLIFKFVNAIATYTIVAVQFAGCK